MNIIKNLFTSSVGKKFIMAVTGGFLVLFVTGHMVGNLQIFLGREVINAYGQLLQASQELLWLVRLSLLTILGLHIWSATQLTLENKAARPLTYEGNPAPTAASYASRTMYLSGVIIAAFVIYHLLHYTARVEAINFTGTDFRELHEVMEHGGERHDIYTMMILGFRQPLVSVFYLVGVGLLCFHLSHGVQAMFQSLGWKNRQYGPLINRVAPVYSSILFLGYASIPVAVLLGFGKAVGH